MSTLFVSDLHLDVSRPEVTEAFIDFLRNEAGQTEALYILGDLFETWIGDDAADEHQRKIMAAIREFTAAGVPCRFMRGNRDFLIGQRFAEETGVELLEDPSVHDIQGTPVLLMHGDLLCTSDTAYLRYREKVHQPRRQKLFLMLPRFIRQYIAWLLRKRSMAAIDKKPPVITDVTQSAVEARLKTAGVSTLLHGHTHRPGIHEFELDGSRATRIVLGDWYEQGSILRWTARGFELTRLAWS